MWKKISVKGVVVGALVDVVGTNIWFVVLVFYLASKYQIYLLPQAQQMNQLKHLMVQDPVLNVLNLLIGGGFSVVGGYIAARIAKRNELLNGALSSFLCLLFALFAITKAPVSQILIGIFANPLLGFVGGYLQLRVKKKRK